MLEAQVSEDLAELLPSPDDVVSALRRARACWLRCHAHREVARLDQRLRDVGARAVNGPTLATVLGLSPAEDRVAREALNGGSNADIGSVLFLSKNTVAAHLRRIYTKTGTKNRQELRGLIQAAAASSMMGDGEVLRFEVDNWWDRAGDEPPHHRAPEP